MNVADSIQEIDRRMKVYLERPRDYFSDACCAEMVFIELDSLRQSILSENRSHCSPEFGEFCRREGLGTNTRLGTISRCPRSTEAMLRS